MTFEVCGAGISKSAKTTKNHQKPVKTTKKTKKVQNIANFHSFFSTNKKKRWWGGWWLFYRKEFFFEICRKVIRDLMVFWGLFDMCGCGCIGLVMKATPLHLQAVGAKHPEAKQEKNKNHSIFLLKRSIKPWLLKCVVLELASQPKPPKTTKNP